MTYFLKEGVKKNYMNNICLNHDLIYRNEQLEKTVA